MAIYVLRRLAAALLLLWMALSVTFILAHMVPGEPSVLYENMRMDDQARQELRQLHGWDQPLAVQYVRYVGNMLRGEMGVSVALRRPVAEVLWSRLPPTAALVCAGLALEHLLGIFLGIAVAKRAGSRFDHAVRWFSLALHATPAFVLGILLIQVLAIKYSIFPAQHLVSAGHDELSWFGQQLDMLRHLVLPAATIALVRFGAVVRFVRNGLLETLEQDYIRTARAKGLSERRILWLHALPMAVGPLIQRLGMSLPVLLGGVVVLEVVFGWPGLGTVIYAAIQRSDYPLILGATAFSGALAIFGSLVADLLHVWLDPRARQRYV